MHILDSILFLASAGGGAVSLEGLKPDLNFIDWSILAIYLAFVIGIGFALKKYNNSAEDFFLSGRSIPG